MKNWFRVYGGQESGSGGGSGVFIVMDPDGWCWIHVEVNLGNWVFFGLGI